MAAQKFVQIIAFETDRIDEMRTLAMKIEERFGSKEHGPSYQAVLKDRNQPNRYYEVLQFDSFDEAARSRQNPESREFAERMAALCTNPPSFLECDVLEESR
ncbi:hypothetical protein [Streptomyces sp. SID4985]|uniref:hypothetical protein n=1 Tax=unclassified Streptomyces TaxID=2593676 RepID=UPI00136861D7|nr:hypothetical protein [Streptomyces sp. SID4985]